MTKEELLPVIQGFVFSGKDPFIITEEIVDFISTTFEPKQSDNTSGVNDWIDEWLSLFPANVKSGGKLLRSDKKSCLAKMKTFVRSYKYDKNTIIMATHDYLKERKREDYAYTRTAIYFIDKKGEGSDLAAWCEKIFNNNIGIKLTEEKSFSDFV